MRRWRGLNREAAAREQMAPNFPAIFALLARKFSRPGGLVFHSRRLGIRLSAATHFKCDQCFPCKELLLQNGLFLILHFDLSFY